MQPACLFLAIASFAQPAPRAMIAIQKRENVPLWTTRDRYRFALDAPLLPQRREGQIAWADIPFALAMKQLGHHERALSWKSLRLVRAGFPEPIPFSIERRGAAYRLAWRRTDDASKKAQRYYLYFDIEGHGETTLFPPPVFVGVGDRLEFGRPGTKDFVGWGLWATPFVLDWENDRDWDLIVYASGPASGGSYLFINDGKNLFSRGQYIGDSGRVLAGDFNGDGRIDAMKQGGYFADVAENHFEKWVKLNVDDDYYHGRFTYWLPVDWNGDGTCDVLAATSDWRQYGWDAGYDDEGNWRKGLLHAALYIHLNKGSPARPNLQKGVRLVTTDKKPIDSFGLPVPCAADWDGDGDLDLIVGSFVDWLVYYENTGSRTKPRLEPGREVKQADGKELRLHHCMMQPLPVDWDRDGDVDLIIGEEDGLVSFVENVAGPKSEPRFRTQVYLRALDVPVRTGALCVPNLVDWDADGDDDLITGCSQGMFELFTNVGSNAGPAFQRTGYLKAGEKQWRILAGVNGSIQGPAEAKWGYTAPHVADWDADGRLDVVTNSIWGKILWAKNVGTKTHPQLAHPEPIRVEWKEKPLKPEWTWFQPEDSQLVTQWRTRPFVVDLNHDALPDLVVLDHEGYLAFFERYREAEQLKLKHPKRIFLDEEGNPLRLNDEPRGGSGRVKIELADWDSDGDLDLLRSTKNIGWYENIGSNEKPVMRKRGNLCDRPFCGHTDSPATFDWNRDGKLDLLVGVEDGHFYVFDRSYIDHKSMLQASVMSN